MVRTRLPYVMKLLRGKMFMGANTVAKSALMDFMASDMSKYGLKLLNPMHRLLLHLALSLFHPWFLNGRLSLEHLQHSPVGLSAQMKILLNGGMMVFIQLIWAQTYFLPTRQNLAVHQVQPWKANRYCLMGRNGTAIHT